LVACCQAANIPEKVAIFGAQVVEPQAEVDVEDKGENEEEWQ
jgi:hypothetical protein